MAYMDLSGKSLLFKKKKILQDDFGLQTIQDQVRDVWP